MPQQRSVWCTGGLELAKRKNLHRRGPQAKGVSGVGTREHSGAEHTADFSSSISHESEAWPLRRICLDRRKGRPFFSFSACFYLPLEDAGVILTPRKWPEVRRIWALEESSMACSILAATDINHWDVERDSLQVVKRVICLQAADTVYHLDVEISQLLSEGPIRLILNLCSIFPPNSFINF